METDRRRAEPLERAGDLGVVIASAGLASNLAALKALAGEGIQEGHMRLHARKAEVAQQGEEQEAPRRAAEGKAP